jgi:DNA excision repair protein ERCC-4
MGTRASPSITVDQFELASGMLLRLEHLGLTTTVRSLPAGDYATGSSIVERKTVHDLHVTLRRGRFWSQLGKLKMTGLFAYLLVEGPSLDDGPVHPHSIRGVLLATMEQRVRVIRSESADDSALWLARLAYRGNAKRRDRALYAQRPKPETTTPEAMLAAVRGVSQQTAKAMLDEFGSIAALVRASPEELARVPGIGPKRAALVNEVLNRSQPLREREGRAT